MISLVEQTFLSARQSSIKARFDEQILLLASSTMGIPNSPLHRNRRRLPHWMQEGRVYFVTFRVSSGKLNNHEICLMLEHLRKGQALYYELAAAVVLPDHVHLLIKPREGYTLSRVMKGIKGVSAHLINRHRGVTGSVWQDESWDRILRDQEEFWEKAGYMLNNPVKAGLVKGDEVWVGWYWNSDLS